jgi:superfamily II DNA/RNA helicase
LKALTVSSFEGARLKFSELNLDPTLMSAIDKLGYTECTPIQAAAIPPLLEGQDLSGLAQTGTGKTAAFLIPLMDRILKNKMPNWGPQSFILVLVPTRELAEQVYQNILTLSEFNGMKGIAIYGGTSYDKQKEAMKNGVQIVVATPGRLIDLYKEHIVDLKQVRAMVFDEADRMFDMGFKDDMKYILQRSPKERQIAVFSATLNFDVLNTIYQFGSYPVEIDVSRDQTKAENVKDEIFHCGREDKPKYLLSIIKKHNPRQVIVFSNFKNNVERLANFLSSNGVPAVGISSLLTQAQRNRVLEQFKAENEKNILVATDVAARGLDIKGVDMVINFDLPMDSESYVHRIGRTGRAGAEGLAFSLVGDQDVESLQRIEDYLKHKLNIGWIEDAEIIQEFKPLPREDRRPDRFQDRGGGRSPEGRPHQGGGRPQGGGPRNDRGPRREGAPKGPRREGGDNKGPRPASQNARGPHKGPRPHSNNGSNQEHQRRPLNGAAGAGPRPQHGKANGPGPVKNPRTIGPNGSGKISPPRHRGKIIPVNRTPPTVLGKVKKWFKGLVGSKS